MVNFNVIRVSKGDHHQAALVRDMVKQNERYDPWATIDADELLQEFYSGHALILCGTGGGCTRPKVLLCVVVREKRNGDRVLHVLIALGEHMHMWIDEAISTLTFIAESEGCSELSLAGRPGWQRALRDYGFKTAEVTMALPVEANNGIIRSQQQRQH